MMFVVEFFNQPLYQFAAFLLITIVLAPFSKGKPTNAIWNLAGLLYVAFIVTNTVLLFRADGEWRYILVSLGASVLYILAVGVIIPFYAKILKLEGPGESATIFLFIIYHPVALVLAFLVKWLINSL